MKLQEIFDKDGTVAKKWNSPWVGVPAWLIFAFFTEHWLHYPPSPGKAIGVLAVVAGFISVRDTKVLGKIIWIGLLVCLLVTEFRAIDKDRAENSAEQRQFFQDQREGFEAVTRQAKSNFDNTAAELSVTVEGLNRAIGGINSTLKAANTTIKQTQPEAYVEFVRFAFGQSLAQTWTMGHPFSVGISFKNIGSYPATKVYKFGKFYWEDNTEEGIKTAYEEFQKDFEAEKRGPSFLARDVERAEPEIEQGFSTDQMNQVQSGRKRIIFFFQAKYSDRNGRWGTLICRSINPISLMHSSGFEDEDQCPPYRGVRFNNPRFSIRER